MDEKPIKVMRYTSGHKTETRIYTREIAESYCAEPGCEFKGHPTAQGVCFSQLTPTEREYIDSVEKRALAFLEDIKKRKSKNYLATLERYFISDKMNEEFTLDALITLRAENAKLKLKLGKWKTARVGKPSRKIKSK